MENQSSTVEADAVHHRLSNQVNTVKDFPYRCYDCPQLFTGLEDLAQHSIKNPTHSEEMCLKCKKSIIVFFTSKCAARIHSCNKSDVCHNHSDLHFHSQFLFTKLNSSGLIPDYTVIGCDLQSCKASFDFSANGIFKYLKHVNRYKHTTVPDCRKCALPEFQLSVGGGKTISHFCVKTGKIICIVKTTASVSSR